MFGLKLAEFNIFVLMLLMWVYYLLLGWLQAIVIFLITIHAYSNERSEMEELSMVALSGSIWLQAFVVTLEMKYESGIHGPFSF
jgi:hypothetical protein